MRRSADVRTPGNDNDRTDSGCKDQGFQNSDRFFNKRGFAFVSFNPCRKAKDCPEVWMTVTFGLSYRKESPRIDVATEPYPNRWTHHVTVGSLDEIDGELIGWIREASDFSAQKR